MVTWNLRITIQLLILWQSPIEAQHGQHQDRPRKEQPEQLSKIRAMLRHTQQRMILHTQRHTLLD